MLATKNAYIQSAYHQLQIISQDEKKKLEYEAREKAVLDYNQSMLEAEQRGELRGERRGEQRGEQRATERINRLNHFLLQEKRYADLERATKDPIFQNQLLEELGL